jgi:hypothetical protein
MSEVGRRGGQGTWEGTEMLELRADCTRAPFYFALYFLYPYFKKEQAGRA